MIVTSQRRQKNIPFNANEIDKTHGTGKPFVDKERKKKVRAIIVKFKSWKERADQKIM